MTGKHKLLTALAGFHLILIVLGAMHLHFGQSTSALGQAGYWYGTMTGAGSSHGFFAPGLTAPVRIMFQMYDAEGQEWTDTIAFGSTSESNVRLKNISVNPPDLEAAHNDPMMKSLAGTMFGKHPEAVLVVVQFQYYVLEKSDPNAEDDFPTMEEWRAGKRPEWVTFYQLPYQRKQYEQQ